MDLKCFHVSPDTSNVAASQLVAVVYYLYYLWFEGELDLRYIIFRSLKGLALFCKWKGSPNFLPIQVDSMVIHEKNELKHVPLLAYYSLFLFTCIFYTWCCHPFIFYVSSCHGSLFLSDLSPSTFFFP